MTFRKSVFDQSEPASRGLVATCLEGLALAVLCVLCAMCGE